jgi:cohesin complex subunit SA-1/2
VSSDHIILCLDAILNPVAALQSVVEDFLDVYKKSSGPPLAELINCVLRACGCNSSVDSDQVLDSDGVVDTLDDLTEEIKKVRSTLATTCPFNDTESSS